MTLEAYGGWDRCQRCQDRVCR